MKSAKRTEFLRSENGNDIFNFICVGCQSAGELSIPQSAGMQPFGCPEGCGATYVCWRPGETPVLKCVVQPLFR